MVMHLRECGSSGMPQAPSGSGAKAMACRSRSLKRRGGSQLRRIDEGASDQKNRLGIAAVAFLGALPNRSMAMLHANADRKAPSQ